MAEMILCPVCLKSIPADARFCPMCGKPVMIHCPHCGAEKYHGGKFCHLCGTSIVGSAVKNRTAAL